MEVEHNGRVWDQRDGVVVYRRPDGGWQEWDPDVDDAMPPLEYLDEQESSEVTQAKILRELRRANDVRRQMIIWGVVIVLAVVIAFSVYTQKRNEEREQDCLTATISGDRLGVERYCD